tara:strand:+ start:882 stop:1157 length:276 start_codon:yes stop_codon:yes gene_type:complete
MKKGKEMKKAELQEAFTDLKIEHKLVEAQNEELRRFLTHNTQAITNLQQKVRELESLASHYERTVAVMGGRIQEKDNLISEQKNKIKESEI